MMRQATKFLALSGKERWLLTKAFVVVGLVRLGLWLLPFRVLRPLLARLAPMPAAAEPGLAHDADHVAWAISAAARYVPRASCLTQALAAQQLLVRCGEPSEIHIGVRRDAQGGVAGHAWLTARGKILLGDQSLESYIPLTDLPRRSLQSEWRQA